MVEHLTFNQVVPSSSLGEGSEIQGCYFTGDFMYSRLCGRREEVIRLRCEKKLNIDQIREKLGLSRIAIYFILESENLLTHEEVAIRNGCRGKMI